MTSVGPPTQAEFHDAIEKRSDRWYSACLSITRDPSRARRMRYRTRCSAPEHKRHQFDRCARLDTWIHRIAVNAALQLLRKRRPDAWEVMDADVEDDTTTPDSARAEDELNIDLMHPAHREGAGMFRAQTPRTMALEGNSRRTGYQHQQHKTGPVSRD